MDDTRVSGLSFTNQPMTAPPGLAFPFPDYEAHKECLLTGAFHQPKSPEVYANDLCFLVESMIPLSSMQFELSLCTLLRTLQVDPNLWNNIHIRKLRTQQAPIIRRLVYSYYCFHMDS